MVFETQGLEAATSQVNKVNAMVREQWKLLDDDEKKWEKLQNVVNASVSRIKGNIDQLNASWQNTQKKFLDGLNKINSQTGALTKSFLGLVAGGAGFTNIMKTSLTTLGKYNDALSAASGHFRKYGMGMAEVEARAKGLSRALHLTRMEVLEFFQAYEQGFRAFSGKEFENLMTNIQRAIGLNVKEQGAMLKQLGSLVQKVPELEQAITSLDTASRKRVDGMVRMMFTMGEINASEYKAYQTYIRNNRVITAEEKARNAEIKNQQRSFQEMRQHLERFALAFGRSLMPVVQKFTAWLDDNSDKVARFFGKMSSLIQSAISGWDKWKNVILAVGTALLALKAGAMIIRPIMGAMAFIGASGAIARAGGLAAGAAGAAGGGAGWMNLGAVGMMGKKGTRWSGTKLAGGALARGGGLAVGSLLAGSVASSMKESGMTRSGSAVGLGGNLLGVGSGMMMGSMFGPIGTAIGGIVGGLVQIPSIIDNISGLLGNSTDEMRKQVEAQKKVSREIQTMMDDFRQSESVNDLVEADIDKRQQMQRIEQGRQAGLKTAFDPQAFSDVRKKALSSDAGLSKAIEQQEEYLKNQELLSYSFAGRELTFGFDERSISELGKEAIRVKNLRDSISAKLSELGDGGDQKAISQHKADLNALDKILGKMTTAISSYKDNHKKVQQDFERASGISIEAMKEENDVLTSQFQTAVMARQQRAKYAQAEASLTQAQIGLFKERLELLSMTGNVSQDNLVQSYEKITADLDRQVSFEKERLDILRQDLAIFQDSSKWTEEERKMQKETNFMTIQERKVLEDINNIEASIVSKTKIKAQLAIEVGNAYKHQLGLLSQQSSLVKGLIDLMDNFAIGVGASAEMRVQAVGAIEREVQTMQQQSELQKRMIATAEKDFNNLVKRNDVSAKGIKDRENAEHRLLNLREQQVKTEVDIINKKKEQAQLTRQLRDGWISAMGAMNTGAGMFTKIVIDQQKNLESALQMGAVVSSVSGSLKGGYTKGDQFSAQAPGVIDKAQGGVRGGTYAYETTLGNDPYDVEDTMRQGLYGDAASAMNLQLDRWRGRGRGSSMAGLAVAQNPYYQGSFLAQRGNFVVGSHRAVDGLVPGMGINVQTGRYEKRDNEGGTSAGAERQTVDILDSETVMKKKSMATMFQDIRRKAGDGEGFDRVIREIKKSNEFLEDLLQCCKTGGQGSVATTSAEHVKALATAMAVIPALTEDEKSAIDSTNRIEATIIEKVKQASSDQSVAPGTGMAGRDISVPVRHSALSETLEAFKELGREYAGKETFKDIGEIKKSLSEMSVIKEHFSWRLDRRSDVKEDIKGLEPVAAKFKSQADLYALRERDTQRRLDDVESFSGKLKYGILGSQRSAAVLREGRDVERSQKELHQKHLEKVNDSLGILYRELDSLSGSAGALVEIEAREKDLRRALSRELNKERAQGVKDFVSDMVVAGNGLINAYNQQKDILSRRAQAEDDLVSDLMQSRRDMEMFRSPGTMSRDAFRVEQEMSQTLSESSPAVQHKYEAALAAREERKTKAMIEQMHKLDEMIGMHARGSQGGLDAANLDQAEINNAKVKELLGERGAIKAALEKRGALTPYLREKGVRSSERAASSAGHRAEQDLALRASQGDLDARNTLYDRWAAKISDPTAEMSNVREQQKMLRGMAGGTPEQRERANRQLDILMHKEGALSTMTVPSSPTIVPGGLSSTGGGTVVNVQVASLDISQLSKIPSMVINAVGRQRNALPSGKEILHGGTDVNGMSNGIGGTFSGVHANV